MEWTDPLGYLSGSRGSVHFFPSARLDLTKGKQGEVKRVLRHADFARVCFYTVDVRQRRDCGSDNENARFSQQHVIPEKPSMMPGFSGFFPRFTSRASSRL